MACDKCDSMQRKQKAAQVSPDSVKENTASTIMNGTT